MKIEELDKLENEMWKQHPIGIFVSNKGRVYKPPYTDSIGRTYKGYYAYGSINNSGYKQTGWKGENYEIHRLIAELFIPNFENKPTVDHINRNKTDNRVENLRWATRSEQNYNRGNYNYPKNNANSKQVAQIDIKTNEIIRIWESTKECERNGFNHRAVSACCNNKFNRIGNNIYKGYKWQYVT